MTGVTWLIDIGNSRIKWASIENAAYKAGSALAYSGISQQEIIKQIQNLSGAPSCIYIASVAQEKFLNDLKKCLVANFAVEPFQMITQQIAAGINNGYDDASKLGIDRWLGILAAYNLKPGNALVVDAGSALTLDFVDENGFHQGGLIAPGLSMMREALTTKTAKLGYNTLIKSQCISNTFERNTQDAIREGTLRMMVDFISTEAEKIRNENRGQVNFYLTGGDAPALLPFLDNEWIYKPDLVLNGMCHLVLSESQSTRRIG